MQTRPDPSTLLDAVALFLLEEVAPALKAEKALAFRVLIAANLATIVSGELRTADDRFAAERARLGALLPGVGEPGRLDSPRTSERESGLLALDRELARRLRSGELTPEAALAHLRQTGAETLAVVNPRFDLSEEIERPWTSR